MGPHDGQWLALAYWGTAVALCPLQAPFCPQAARGPIASGTIGLPAPAPQTGQAEVPVLAPPASSALGHVGKGDGVTFPAENRS